MYCDEVKEISSIRPTGENESWIYISLLIIPRSQKVTIFNELMKYRCKNKNNWHKCTQNCSYHEKKGKKSLSRNRLYGYILDCQLWIDYILTQPPFVFIDSYHRISKNMCSYFFQLAVIF